MTRIVKLVAILSLAALPLLADAHSRVSAPPASSSSDAFGSASGAMVSGTVSAIQGTKITLAGSIVIDATNAKILADRNGTAALSSITTGSRIDVLVASTDVKPGAALIAQSILIHSEPDLSVTGPVQSVDVAGKRLVVLGVTVNVDASTAFGSLFPTFAAVKLSDIAVGQIVAIEAHTVSGSIVATKVTIVAPVRMQTVVVRGVVKSMSSSSWVVTDSKTAKDITFVVNAQTHIVGQAVVGDTVQVLANIDATSTYIAVAIVVEHQEMHQMELSGIVKSISPTQWVIGGPGLSPDYQVVVNAQTTIVGAPVVGDHVHVVGQRSSTGTFIASSITKDGH